MTSRYVAVSGVLFGFIAAAQLVRAAKQIPVQVGGFGIPVYASWIAFVVAGSLCVWAFVSSKRGK